MSRAPEPRPRGRNRDQALARLHQIERIVRQQDGGSGPAKLNDGFSARLCYRNALHLYRGGVTSARCNDFGLARSLIILSIEELAKAVAYELIYLGAFSTNRANRGHLTWFDRRCFKCHVCKHELVFRLKAGMDLEDLLGKFDLVKGLFRSAKTVDDAIRDIPTAMTKLSGPLMRSALAESVQRHPERWMEIGKLYAQSRDMEHAKQLGFYVEGWERPPTTPYQVTREEFDKVRLFAESRLDEFFPLLAEEVPKEWRQKTAAIVSAVGGALAAANPNYKFPEIVCTHAKHQLPRKAAARVTGAGPSTA